MTEITTHSRARGEEGELDMLLHWKTAIDDVLESISVIDRIVERVDLLSSPGGEVRARVRPRQTRRHLEYVLDAMVEVIAETAVSLGGRVEAGRGSHGSWMTTTSFDDGTVLTICDRDVTLTMPGETAEETS